MAVSSTAANAACLSGSHRVVDEYWTSVGGLLATLWVLKQGQLRRLKKKCESLHLHLMQRLPNGFVRVQLHTLTDVSHVYGTGHHSQDDFLISDLCTVPL